MGGRFVSGVGEGLKSQESVKTRLRNFLIKNIQVFCCFFFAMFSKHRAHYPHSWVYPLHLPLVHTTTTKGPSSRSQLVFPCSPSVLLALTHRSSFFVYRKTQISSSSLFMQTNQNDSQICTPFRAVHQYISLDFGSTAWFFGILFWKPLLPASS